MEASVITLSLPYLIGVKLKKVFFVTPSYHILMMIDDDDIKLIIVP